MDWGVGQGYFPGKMVRGTAVKCWRRAEAAGWLS